MFLFRVPLIVMFVIQASINVGDTELNVFTIEHFILRHPAEIENVSADIYYTGV